MSASLSRYSKSLNANILMYDDAERPNFSALILIFSFSSSDTRIAINDSFNILYNFVLTNKIQIYNLKTIKSCFLLRINKCLTFSILTFIKISKKFPKTKEKTQTLKNSSKSLC